MAFLLQRLKFACLRHAELDRNQHGEHALGMAASILPNVCAALHTSDGANRINPLQRHVARAVVKSVKSRSEATLPSGLVDLLFLPDLVGHDVLEASTWIPLHSEIFDFFICRPPIPRLRRQSRPTTPVPRNLSSSSIEAISDCGTSPPDSLASASSSLVASKTRGWACVVNRSKTVEDSAAYDRLLLSQPGVGNSWCN